jgi:hypothetical protein
MARNGVSAALLAAALCCATAAPAQAAPSCKVLDPELQGSYSGGCVNGLAEGHGEARGRAAYSGGFSSGRKHGKGVKTWPATGDRYEGDFADDRKHGTGIYVWGRGSASAGERYTGGYIADRRHGHGVYEWPGGERYAGPWEDDRPTGPPTKRMIARARALAERAAVVGIPGAKVCRELHIGVATEDVIRGTVVAREGDSIRVRIDDAGKFEHLLGDRMVRKDEVLSDSMLSWLPCS